MSQASTSSGTAPVGIDLTDTESAPDASMHPEKPKTCSAFFRVRCAASLPKEARKKLLAKMQEIVKKYDPGSEHKKWRLPMATVPPGLEAKTLATWIRQQLFMDDGTEKVSLVATTDLTSEDVYYYEWDEVAQRWYLVCEHTLGLAESESWSTTSSESATPAAAHGSPVSFEFDPNYPDARLEIMLAYRPGKPYETT